jgi:hypothetical protein
VPNQLMTHWQVTVVGLLGPELASTRLPIVLYLRRNPRRKCGTGHPESRSMIRKVPGEGLISADPIGRLNWNLPLCWVLFLTSPVVQDPMGYLFETPLRRILRQLTRSQRVRITRVRVEPKVHPTCQKIQAPRMLHPGQRFQAHATRRNHRVLNRLSPPIPLHQTTVLLAKILLVATLLSLNPKFFLGEPRW